MYLVLQYWFKYLYACIYIQIKAAPVMSRGVVFMSTLGAVLAILDDLVFVVLRLVLKQETEVNLVYSTSSARGADASAEQPSQGRTG